jgi:hypothetical protein
MNNNKIHPSGNDIEKQRTTKISVLNCCAGVVPGKKSKKNLFQTDILPDG